MIEININEVMEKFDDFIQSGGGRGAASRLSRSRWSRGGLIPLAPYILAGTMRTALMVSVALTLTALLVFGYVRVC